jgi:hypothetical protein
VTELANLRSQELVLVEFFVSVVLECGCHQTFQPGDLTP